MEAASKKLTWTRAKSAFNKYSDATGLSDIRRLVPIVTWLPQYTKEKLVGDLVAGLTVGVMLVPQAMAYANLSGLPPVYGLYSAFMSLFVYTIFGTAKDVSLGPTALMSLIVADSFTALEKPPDGFENECSDIRSYDYCCRDGDDFACTPVHLTVAACFVSGLYQIAMGFLNFGALVDFIGFPVFNGFTTAAAVSILANQMRHILGLTNVDRRFLYTVRDIFSQIHKSRWQDIVMGATCIVFTISLEKVKAEFTDRRKFSKKEYVLWLAGTARNAITVVLALIVARIVEASGEGDRVFKLVYKIPSGMPSPEEPLASVSSDDMSEVLLASVTIALLGYLESIAIGKSFAIKNGYNLDPTQELRAVGYASVASSFFSSVPITASFSRSAVNSASAMFTPMGGSVTALCVIVSLEFVTPAFYYVPKASLAAIIITAVVHLFDFPQVYRMAKVNSQDVIVWATSFFACLLWSLEYGILLAVAVSVLISFYNQSEQTLSRLQRACEIGIWKTSPECNTIGRNTDWVPTFVRGASGCSPLVVMVGGDISFSMANKFKERLLAIGREYESEDEVRALIIDMSAVTRIDFTGILAIEAVLDALRPGCKKRTALGEEVITQNDRFITLKKGDIFVQNMKGIRVHLSHVNPRIRLVLANAGLLDGVIEYGDWKMCTHDTVDLALPEISKDLENAEEKWPFEWLVPPKLAKFYPIGSVQEGRNEDPPKNWVCYKDGKGKKMWIRLENHFTSSVV